MIAIEAKYHNRCICALYNRVKLASPMDSDGVEACMHGIAFAELVVFLENASSDDNSLLSTVSTSTSEDFMLSSQGAEFFYYN